MQSVPIMEKYTLIITEKPDAAERIASALDVKEKPKRIQDKGVPYFVAKRDREIVVVPALGHLYTIAGERSGREHYPVFNYRWVPRYAAERGAKRIRPWIQTIAKLSRNADKFIDACDYDLEGSIIGYCILKYACGNKEQVSERMKYSTLTKEELVKAYAELQPHLDFALIEAGRTRHEVDWLYGINLSRALTMAARNWSRRYVTLSTGRVQGPTLKFLVAREKSIKTFVPIPYWKIKAQIKTDDQVLEAEYEKIVETKKEAGSITEACKGKNGQVEKIDEKQFSQQPPFPFDLGSLQREAYRLFRYAPQRTLSVAQRLYLDALISYPRTSSQKLPPSIDYETILKSLGRIPEYRKFTAGLLKPKLLPNEGQKTDPAHPAIYPTGRMPRRALGNPERRIWDLIVRRFMAVFSQPAIVKSLKVHLNIGEHRFHLVGRRILVEGWMRFYGAYAPAREVLLPAMKERQRLSVKRIILEDRFTEPPPRYNPSSLLKKMEQTEIGTKATRADIMQTLQERKYVKSETMGVTTLGFEILETLHKYCPTVVSIELTRELEERMDRIQKGSEKRENVLVDAVEILKPVLEKLKEREKAIGEQLSNAVESARLEEKTIGACPHCGTGKLVILYSRKTSKRFVGCTNYFKELCKTSFPLPQRGMIVPLGGSCTTCGLPTVQVRTRGRRPWTLCLNPACPSKEKRRGKNAMPDVQ